MEAPEEKLAELRELEPVFHNEPREDGRERLEAMMVEDFFEVGASGRIYSREHVLDRVLARIERGEPEAESEVEDFFVRRIGPHAYLCTYTLQLYDGPAKRTSRRTTVWTDREGYWQVIYHQGTLADPTPA